MPLPYLAPGPGECAPDGPRPCRSTGGAPYFAGDPTGVPPPVELPLLWRGRPPVPRGCREDGGAIPDIVSLVTRTIPKSQSRVSRVYTLVARVNGSQRGLTSQPRLFGSLGRDGFRYFDTTKRAKESVQHSRFGIFFATQSPVRSAVRYFVEIAFRDPFKRVRYHVSRVKSDLGLLPNSFCPRSRHQLAQSQTSSCHASYPRHARRLPHRAARRGARVHLPGVPVLQGEPIALTRRDARGLGARRVELLCLFPPTFPSSPRRSASERTKPDRSTPFNFPPGAREAQA